MTASLRHRIFQLFKYAIYGLLLINLYVFFREELLASEYTFSDGIRVAQWFEVYSATIDTAAWIVLLLMFELETAVLDDDVIEGLMSWVLLAARAFCYLFIVFAFFGYWAKTVMLHDNGPLTGTDPCQYVNTTTSYMVDLDEYRVLDAENCQTFAAKPELHTLSGLEIITDSATLSAVIWLAWTDVMNAGTWILVVIFLEIDVWLQLHGLVRKPVLIVSWIVKGVLYLTLLVAAIYWGMNGDFVDFWDAFLWLVAFFFIEMNVVNWRHETEQITDQQDALRH